MQAQRQTHELITTLKEFYGQRPEVFVERFVRRVFFTLICTMNIQ